MLNESTSSLLESSEQSDIPAAHTDIGCEREINEDRYAILDSPNGRAWVVCDGMGGCLGGELAAQLAIDAMRRTLETEEFSTGEEALRMAIEEANRIIVLRRQNPAFSSMGTTIVAAMIRGDEVSITHAGDSRAYLVREGEVQQLTVDHTFVQDLVDRGKITADEALEHPQSHVLTKCLGADPRIELSTENYWIWTANEEELPDKLVLCSDGLYSLVDDSEIAETVSKLSPQAACVELVELARKRGGFDNITLAILPLQGRLHDESAGRSAPKVHKPLASHSRRRAVASGPKLSVGKQLILSLIILMIFGLLSVITIALLM